MNAEEMTEFLKKPGDRFKSMTPMDGQRSLNFEGSKEIH